MSELHRGEEDGIQSLNLDLSDRKRVLDLYTPLHALDIDKADLDEICALRDSIPQQASSCWKDLDFLIDTARNGSIPVYVHEFLEVMVDIEQRLWIWIDQLRTFRHSHYHHTAVPHMLLEVAGAIRGLVGVTVDIRLSPEDTVSPIELPAGFPYCNVLMKWVCSYRHGGDYDWEDPCECIRTEVYNILHSAWAYPSVKRLSEISEKLGEKLIDYIWDVQEGRVEPY